MMSSITIKEISNISGYSISTVSKALNDRYEIKESTKRKIRRIAKLNNYVPNNAARALRNRKTKVIAVIVPKITSPYFNNFICQIQKKASLIGYKVMISQSFEDPKKERESISFMNDGSADGVLILSNNHISDRDFKVEILKNVLVVPYQIEKEFDKEEVKKLASSSLEKILSLILQ